MAPKRNQRALLARALSGAAGAQPAPAVPQEYKRAQELFNQFKKGKKRAKAQEEAEALYGSGPNSALCIALAKMHMTLAVEQALKLDEDGAREEAVLSCLHSALQYAVSGAVAHRSIQCVVLCVFTLHCCRGRGSAEQKQQRQAWHTQLSDALPAGDKAKWAAVGWVDPRLESHATQDRFGFEWNQRGQHPTVEAWAEAVRDDWTKFMHKARVADTIDFKLLERLPTKNPDSLRELLHEVEQPVDRRLAGNVTPLNTTDKEALKQRLDTLDQRRMAQQQAAAGGSGGAGATGSSSTAAKTAAAAAAAPAAPHHTHQSLTSQWLPALHTAQLNKQKQKAEQKRLAEQQARAQQRAALIREYFSLKHAGLSEDPRPAVVPPGGLQAYHASIAEDSADGQLAASAAWTLADLAAAAQQLAASRDLSTAEAELAAANLALLQAGGSGEAGEGSSGSTAQRQHVWYGDPLLSTGETRHSVESYEAMEALLVEQQRQDWSMFEYAGQLVCRDVEGWQAVVSALPVKPMLLREPCPDLLLERFTPGPCGEAPRVYPADLALMDAQWTLGVDRLGGCSDDDAFSDALSRQASLGGSDECLEPAPTPSDEPQQAQQAAEPPRQQQLAADQQQQQQQQQSPAPARRGGKPLLQRVMEALKQQGHLQQKPAAEEGGAVGAVGAAGGPAERAQQHQQPQAEQRADGGPSTPRQQQQQPRLLPLPEDAEDLQSLFVEHHAHEWMPRIAAEWGYTQDQGRQFYRQWIEEGVEARRMEFLDRLADAAKHAWLKDVVEAQLAAGELPPETASALQRMRAELQAADARQKEREQLPSDVLRKKRQRGQEELVLASTSRGAGAGEGGAPLSPRSDAGASDAGSSSSGISWRSGSTGSSLPQLGSMAAADILDSYMRELLHNTLPCLDAILGVYSDAQSECAARLLPEDRLGEVRVEQMVRRGLAGHCMVQLIWALDVGRATRGALAATIANLHKMMGSHNHPTELIWHFIMHRGAAEEAEGAYQALLDLERRSQGRVMSRPVSAVTRVLAPLLLQEWRAGEHSPEVYVERSKRVLARMTLGALRHLHARGRLMEGVLWQLNSYILSCLEKSGDAAADREQQEELSKLWEELADVAHDNQDCFNYCAQLPLRSMLPLYAFVGMLCAEAFCCASDIHPLLEDVYVEGRAIARLDEPEAASGEGASAAQPSPDQATLVLLPAAVSDFIAAADDAAVAAIGTPAEAVPARRGGRGGVDVTATLASGRVALLADYAAGVTEAQRAQARLAAGGAGGLPYVGLGLGASPPTGTDDLLDRSRVAQQLHRLLYAEAVLGQLFQRCEDISDGLEATSQVLRFMAKGLDEFIAGTLSEPLPPAPPLHVEQQLRDAQYALAAADCAQLALMLANERLRAAAYADTLSALQMEHAAAGEVADAGSADERASSIAAAVERFSRLHADMQEESRHDRAALQQLASSLAAPASIPLLKSVDLENVAIVDSVLQFAQNIGNVSQPSLQPAIEQYRSILADKQAEAHERLEQVKAYVVAASRQLEHQRSQLGVLLEWCRIRQLSLIGQMRSNYCCHSVLDQLADVAVRAAAALRWEPELRQMQEQERQANMLALQQELEAEAAQAEKRAARAEKRKAQKTKRAAAAAEQANGVGNGGSYSSDSEEEQAAQQVAQPPRQQQQAAAEPRQKAAAQPPASPNKAAAASKAAKKGEGKQTAATERSSQAAAYQRMLEEYGLDAEAASFAQQLAAKQAPRQQDGAAPPAAAAKQQQAATAAAPAAPAGSPAKTASGKAAILVPPVTVKAPPPPPTAAKARPASAPAGSSGGGGGSAPGAAGAGGGSSGEPGSNTVLVKPHGARELMRVIGYYGDWLCFCGDVNKLWDTCGCGQAPPCRDWVRGICKYSGSCRFSHPPFDLPDATTIPMSERIAKPSADAPLYRKGQVVLPAAAKAAAAAAAKAAAAQKRAASATVVPAVPAVNAWQKPLVQPTPQSAAGSQQVLPPPPPPPPPKVEQPQEQQQQQQQAQQQAVQQQQQQQMEQVAALPAITPEPLQAVAPASAEPTLLSAGSGGSGGLGGWNPIGSSSFGLGSSTGIALAAAASADSSRAATPALVGSAGELGGLAAAAGGDLLVYPFPAAGSSLHGSLSAASSLGGVAAAAGPGRPWEQRNGGLGGALGGGLGPTGDESAFLSQLMQGLDVGDEHGDADLASLLGPIAADVGDVVGPSLGGTSVGSPTRLPLGATLQRPASAPLHTASPQRAQQQPSLLDGLALQQAAAAAQQLGSSSSSALSATAAQAQAAARDGGVLVALAHCLWACAPFRRLVLSWPEIVYKADPVVAALWRALAAYAGAAAGGSVSQMGPAGVAAAAELSDTLAGHLFGAGRLGDGGEVLLGMYQRVREVESMRGIPSGVDQCFGLQLTEGVQCASCGKVTRRTAFTQYFVTAAAAALRAAAARAGPGAGLGALLRLAEDAAPRSCDPDVGGCGAPNKLLQLLERPPRVVAVQLSWESAAAGGAGARATLAAAGERLDLSQLYLGLHPGAATYRLGAMLCHRPAAGGGTACQAFVLDGASGQWLGSAPGGGAGVGVVGGWAALLHKCEAEAVQPALLFYM